MGSLTSRPKVLPVDPPIEAMMATELQAMDSPIWDITEHGGFGDFSGYSKAPSPLFYIVALGALALAIALAYL